MAKRINNSVTLSHADAQRIAFLLADYAGKQARHARNTKSASIQVYCNQTAAECREIANQITKSLWSWSDDVLPVKGK